MQLSSQCADVTKGNLVSETKELLSVVLYASSNGKSSIQLCRAYNNEKGTRGQTK